MHMLNFELVVIEIFCHRNKIMKADLQLVNIIKLQSIAMRKMTQRFFFMIASSIATLCCVTSRLSKSTIFDCISAVVFQLLFTIVAKILHVFLELIDAHLCGKIKSQANFILEISVE